jgi:hypothetical protein
MAEATPLQPEEVLPIVIQDSLEFDTHATDQEHALKELGSWQEYSHLLSQQGGSLPDSIEDPFDHYLQSGPGRFYRAYSYEQGMVAGFTMSPSENQGMQIDSLYCMDYDVPEASVAASALHKLLTHKAFEDFSGMSIPSLGLSMPALKYIDVPATETQNMKPLARALFFFGLPFGENYRIPMSDRTVFLSRELKQEKVDEVKEKMPEGFSGILSYAIEGQASVNIEEFFRDRTHLGTITSTYGGVGGDGNIKSMEATSADGTEVKLFTDYTDYTYGDSARQVHFLQTLAQSDPELAAKILT